MSYLKDKLERAAKESPLEFPGAGKVNYYGQLSKIEDFLGRNVHPHVEKGPLVQEDGFLTDHGPEHIETVCLKAGSLAKFPTCDLSAYEVYLLLAAIQFHDVGNLYGREDHEKKAFKIMDEMGHLAGEDDVEKKMILRIASAHGGMVNGNRDTISFLEPITPLLGQDVRPQFLAAILRFADELSDCSHRAARFLLTLNEVLPEESQIYHRYAQHLDSVVVRPESSSVDFLFYLDQAAAVNKFQKGNKKIFLLDEIFERTMKTHRERVYCMRFMVPAISISKLRVEIKVYGKTSDLLPCEQISYTLQEQGYPGQQGSVFEICGADLTCEDGQQWCGKLLKRRLVRN